METVKCNYRSTDIFQFYPEKKTLNRVKTVPRLMPLTILLMESSIHSFIHEIMCTEF